jgi:hypothetical protein
MTHLKNLLLLSALLALSISFFGCHKVENTTPRYDTKACILCTAFGHPEDAGKCFACKGSAVCQFCQGKGKRLVGKDGKYYEETCAFCQGAGKCHYCSSTGKCVLCKGSGLYVPLAPSLSQTPATPPAVPQPSK